MSSYRQRFPGIFATIDSGVQCLFFYDQDGTLTVKIPGRNEAELVLHADVVPAVIDLIAAGGIYVPSSARPIWDLKAAYDAAGKLNKAANDGYVIETADGQLVYFGVMPDYAGFEADLKAFTGSMAGVTVSNMGAFFGLFIDKSHPRRADCEAFFESKVGPVGQATGIALEPHKHPMGLTVNPADNRNKDGVIAFFIDQLGLRDAVEAGEVAIFACGDANNDIPALVAAKGFAKGHAIKVLREGEGGSFDYATEVTNDVEDNVGLFKEVVKAYRAARA
jgi:hypothetical protein